MKYIPLIENLEELLSLGYFEEKDTDINNLILYNTDYFIYDFNIKDYYYKCVEDFYHWHDFERIKFKKDNYYIYVNDEFINIT